jgi:glutaredoxin 3
MTSEYPGNKVEIYTWMTCGYCVRAKRLLKDKNITFIEYAIDGDDQARQRMIQRAAGRSSVPQIFVNGQGIGGFLELQQLEHDGHLDGMLESQAEVNEEGDQGALL